MNARGPTTVNIVDSTQLTPLRALREQDAKLWYIKVLRECKMTKFVHDQAPQAFFDAYNDFIMSSDLKTFAKLASKLRFTELTKNLPGDIVELGVFKGSGLFGWLKANAITSVNNKTVYGFDIFDETQLIKTLSGKQASLMASLFQDRGFTHGESSYYDFLNRLIADCGFKNFELIKGDVRSSLETFLQERPGFRASIINFDLDVDEPTYASLQLLWPRLVKGGIAIFDEYAIGEWDESNAVDRFFADHHIRLQTTGCPAPTAYVIKE